MTEIDAEGDLYCLICTRTVVDPTRLAHLAETRDSRRRRPYTAMLAEREKIRLSIVCNASRCSVPEIVWLLLAEAGPLPADHHTERCHAGITVMLSDAELCRLSELGGDVPISSLVRRLVRWGLPRLEREYGLAPVDRHALLADMTREAQAMGFYQKGGDRFACAQHGERDYLADQAADTAQGVQRAIAGAHQ